jgi:hypothetical protein
MTEWTPALPETAALTLLTSDHYPLQPVLAPPLLRLVRES